MGVRLIPSRMIRLFKTRERFRIIAMDRMAPRIVRIRLAPETGAVLPYRAGQFLFACLGIPGLPRKVHPFTISNPPGGSFIEIMVKGTNTWTLDLYDRAENFPRPERQATGTSWMAWVDYPYGSFTNHFVRTGLGAGTGPWVFLATGIGIAPFLAMAGDRLNDDAQTLILWAADTRDELAGFEQLSAINARKPSIRMIPILGHDPLWPGRRGQLDRQALLDLAQRELADPQARYWICCPSPLRRSLVKDLKSLGVPRKHIRYEDCTS